MITLYQLEKKLEKLGETEAATFLAQRLSGEGCSTGGEMASEIVGRLPQFVNKFRRLLSLDDIANLQAAREAYAKDNHMIEIGEIE
jgi:hypothetical protein